MLQEDGRDLFHGAGFEYPGDDSCTPSVEISSEASKKPGFASAPESTQRNMDMNKRSQSSRKRVEEFKKLKEEGSAKVLASSYNSPAENQQAFSVAAGGGAEEQEVVDDIREEEEEVAAESETYLDRHKPQKVT